jgi:lysophospholipase L1-like esterase
MKFSVLILEVLITSLAMAQNLPEKKTLKFLALGDSYTIGESVSDSQRWPVQLVSKLREQGYQFSEPFIIATTGWRTDDLKRAIDQAKPKKNYDLVSLLIGVNNQYQGKSAKSYEPEFEELLNIAIQHAGDDKSKVFVVSIPDYGFTPFSKPKQEAITTVIDEFNAVNKRITEKYGITYINITDISRQGLEKPDLVAEDGLHPSGKMYAEWVSVILKQFKF